MTYNASGGWVPWPNVATAVTNSSDPFSSTINTVNSGFPLLLPIFLGALYVFLWLMFRQSPSRFKIVVMTVLVFVISIFFAAAGWTPDALLNFVVFVVAYFVEFLFNRRG